MAPRNSIANKKHPRTNESVFRRCCRAVRESAHQWREERQRMAAREAREKFLYSQVSGRDLSIYDRPNPCATRMVSLSETKYPRINNSTVGQTKEARPKDQAEPTKQAGSTTTTKDTIKLAESNTITNQTTTTKTSEKTQQAKPVQTKEDGQHNQERLSGRCGCITQPDPPKEPNPASAQTTSKPSGSVPKTRSVLCSRKPITSANYASGTSRRISTSCLFCPRKIGNWVAYRFDAGNTLPAIPEQEEQEEQEKEPQGDREREEDETDNLSNVSYYTALATPTKHNMS